MSRERSMDERSKFVQAVRMHHARTLGLCIAIACVGWSEVWALPPRFAQEATVAAPAFDLATQTKRIDESNTARAAGDHAGARAITAEVVSTLLARPVHEQDAAFLDLLESAGIAAYEAQDSHTTHTAWKRVYEARSALFSDDHPDLQRSRVNLASILSVLGDLAGARALQEKVLEVRSRTLPDDHKDLQTVRLNLAATLLTLGDLPGARTLFEKVLEVYSRQLPDDHPNLQVARINLAATVKAQGDFASARPLEEKALDVLARTLPDDHPYLQAVRTNLAGTLYELGELEAARPLFEKVLEVSSRTLPDEHPQLQAMRGNLAATLRTLGDLEPAQALYEHGLEVFERTLPDEHPDLQAMRKSLAETLVLRLVRESDSSNAAATRARCSALIGDLCRAQLLAARAALAGGSAREAEERCASMTRFLGASLSFAHDLGVFEPLVELESSSFALAESMRGAAISAATLARSAARSPRYSELRAALRAASDTLASLAQAGTTSEEFDRARVKREAVERELAALARQASDEDAALLELDVASLAARIGEGCASVSFRRFTRWGIDLDATRPPARRESEIASLCAFVVRDTKASSDPAAQPGPKLTLVDLGPIAPIESAARAWRDAVGVGRERGMMASDSERDVLGERGDELRRLVFDPLLPALGDARRIVLVLDDVLHLVPLDALPLDATDSDGALASSLGRTLVGDRWRIETRATLVELFASAPEPAGTALLALGGASFNAEPLPPSEDDSAALEVDQPTQVAALLRGGAWDRGFAPLPQSGEEARGLGALYGELVGGARPALVLEKRKASRDALTEFAPRARYLHVATHGWFAPESIRSWSDPEPLDKQSGLGSRLSGEQQVKGMSPMLLCGLALSGANLPEDASGRAPGLVTADELSTLDLSNCELAVLSACDTNVGERRAGQGVASLQRALQMAGARSVITSLWKVPDEATKELMLDFYRRLWVAKRPKWQALWEAKSKLREARDERGAPKYTTRDWAAWVLTGNPE